VHASTPFHLIPVRILLSQDLVVTGSWRASPLGVRVIHTARAIAHVGGTTYLLTVAYFLLALRQGYADNESLTPRLGPRWLVWEIRWPVYSPPYTRDAFHLSQ
jgi:hypothetical protein